MWISALQLNSFRNYDQLSVSLKPGINLFIGENGAGKTNLVEACVFLSDLQSHRANSYLPLIAQGRDSAQLSLTVTAGTREIQVATELNRSKPNRYSLNGNLKRRSSDLVGAVQVVVFSPEDLDLVRRDPADRRGFLDTAVIQLKPRMAGVKSDYERVLKQKNALLKSARSTSTPDLTTLDIWDDQLVAFGSELIEARLELISLLEPLIQDFYQKLAGSKDLIGLGLAASIENPEEDGTETLQSLTRSEISERFHSRISEQRSKELERGISLVGPHRDELLITKSGLPARSHSSQGEAWSIALGLKLALAHLIRERSQQGDPVLVLDDVFAVLDSGRRNRLVEYVSANEQVLITSADPDQMPNLDIASTFRVAGGVVDA
ncbi:DNA replication/repair protein RecF [Aquiluna borgnonia]|uniref:DNA replication and repair protein RecF n=1 Tax=Aquiluna borgnonia TaxID=2499157 RepID=A0A7D4UL05_9MICO|nr:DNA replication/repair protein RecF [Aquiluna borgnonia]QKJ24638.1 DNA replication/repair protein RecF [Aquiluna borgnonia]